MTVEEIREKLKEFTDEKIEIEPSRNEMIGALYSLCNRTKRCNDCCLIEECKKRRNMIFTSYNKCELKECYKKVVEKLNEKDKAQC